MRNGKEVMVLVIMIFVVLVSAAKAEVKVNPSQFEIHKEQENTLFGLNDLAQEQRSVAQSEGENNKESSIKVRVGSPSSLSEISEEYGLIVTISKSF